MVAGDGHATDVRVGKTTDTGSVAQLSHDVGVKMVGEAYPLRTAMSLPVSAPGDLQIVSAPAAVAPAVVDAAPFDKSKSVSQLIQDGSIRRSEAPSPAPEVAKPGAQAGVTVTYADAAANDPTKVPDFIIKKDGTIEATGDFEALQRKNVVVQVERLQAQGHDTSTLARIHGPAGLDIGAVSPAEIAISIMAESFDPTSTRFDVVIIDEASQADLNALIPLYLGKQEDINARVNLHLTDVLTSTTYGLFQHGQGCVLPKHP